MERLLLDLEPAASSRLFGSGLHLPETTAATRTQQSPPQQARVSAASVPASVSLRTSLPVPQQISFSTSSSSSSPDPPASGPGPSDMASTSRSQSRAHSMAVSSSPDAAAFRFSRAAVAAAAVAVSSQPLRSRHRRSTRNCRRNPRTTEEDSTVSAASDEAVRRSSRTRKRPPTALVASLPPSSVSTMREDPPAKRAKRAHLKKPPPGPKTEDDDAEDSKLPAKGEVTASCCICMDEPKPADLASIKACEHLFCFECIEKWSERENTCPLCKVRFTKIDRVNKAKKKSGSRAKNSKRVKQKDQRSDLAPGAALEGLLASFASSANFPPHRVARLIFSGMGGAGNPFMLPRRGAAQRAGAPGAHFSMEDPLWSDGTDDEDDGPGFFVPSMGSGAHPHARSPPSISSLLRSLPMGAGGGARFAMHGLHPLSLNAFDPPPPGRNYASNNAEQGSGRQANPLVIDDSDDDEDDVEVVHVSRPR